MTNIMEESVISGYANQREVFIGAKYLSPKRSQKIRNHSPDGFNWGYGGSGPAQLALGILLELTDEDTAKRLYQDFKFNVIATLPMGKDFKLPVFTVLAWLKAKTTQLS